MTYPTRAVTFLFTDIEGSTRLWEMAPAAMREVLIVHDRILHEAISAHGGVTVKSTGDGLLAVFPRPEIAILATVDMQRLLNAADWDPRIGPLRVRMGIHSGTSEEREGDHYGPDVNLAARLMAAAHGGQVLLSAAAWKSASDHLPDEITASNLGAYHLRDVERPLVLYQLVAPGLADTFPRLRSTARPLTNLPKPTTAFIGRDQELADLLQLLQRPAVRLVSLVGPGGAGKTRLAQEVATRLLPEFADGVYLADLATADDSHKMMMVIAAALGLRAAAGQPLAEAVRWYLRERHILLILDNFEQLLRPGETAGLAEMAGLLAASERAIFLITTREALRLPQEWRYELNGLAVPATMDQAAAQYEAVRLFSERARQVRFDFSAQDNLEAVVEICQLVEGMPLAIELAAAWVSTLEVEELAASIRRGLDVLSGTLRNIPARHRSIEAVFAYSWELLGEEGRRAFRRLAVFPGSFGQEAAVAVAGESLLTLAHLVDKSLLRREQGNRFRIPVLLRHYAIQRLDSVPEEAAAAAETHATYYLHYVNRYREKVIGPGLPETITAVGSEIENIRAAWHWAVANGETAELPLNAAIVELVLQAQSRYQEGMELYTWAVSALSDASESASNRRALAAMLNQLAWFAVRLGQLDLAQQLADRSAAIFRDIRVVTPKLIGTNPLAVLALLAILRGEYAEGRNLAQQLRQQAREQEDQINQHFALYLNASASLAQGEYEAAFAEAQEAYEGATRQQGDRWLSAYMLIQMGEAQMAMGHYQEAQDYFEASFIAREAFHDPEGMANALNHLGRVAFLQGQYDRAQAHYRQSLAIYEGLYDRGGLGTALHGLGRVALVKGELATARTCLVEALGVAAETNYYRLLFPVLITVARLFVQSGAIASAAPLLSIAASHPASPHVAQTDARELAQSIPLGLSVAAGDEKELEETLNSIVAATLDELDQPSGLLVTGS